MTIPMLASISTARTQAEVRRYHACVCCIDFPLVSLAHPAAAVIPSARMHAECVSGSNTRN